MVKRIVGNRNNNRYIRTFRRINPPQQSIAQASAPEQAYNYLLTCYATHEDMSSYFNALMKRVRDVPLTKQTAQQQLDTLYRTLSAHPNPIIRKLTQTALDASG